MGHGGLLRFVSFGAGGFGTGGAMAGIAWPLLPVTSGASALLVVLGGAIGGASLGLAMRDRRKAVTLAVLGTVGFGAGSVAAVILGFMGFLPATESGATNAMGAVASGILVGSVGAAALGVVLRDPRKIVLFTLAGAIAFGVGMLIKFSLEHALRLGVAEDALLAAAGIVGGGVLGATLRYLAGVGESRLLSLGAVAGLPMIAALFLMFFYLPYWSICGEEERAAFSEFAPYGGAEVEPGSDSMSGGCVATYEASAPPEEVADHLARRLESHGWEIEHRLRTGRDAEDEFAGTLVAARRGGLRYAADYESIESYERPRPGTHVVVRVWEDEKGRRA